MKSLRTIFFLFLSIITLVPSKVSSDKLEQQVADSNNEFSVNLYKQLLKPQENLICSAFSLSTVLSILWDGAVGLTSTEIQKALLYQDLKQEDVDSGYKTILPSLQSNTNYNLSVANAIFVLKDFTVLQSYIDAEKKNYYADILPLVSVDSVNNWANDNTKGLIPKILDKLDDGTVMVLANAVYFKGSWASKFSKDDSLMEDFKNNDLENKQTNLMHQTSSFPYSESEELNAQILYLPYKGSDMFMIVFLPKEGSTLVDMESKLTASNFKSAINANAINQSVVVTLPKFEIDSSFDLINPLETLGIEEAFLDTADFSKITNETKIKVSAVIQKAIVKVSEEGTEAAAVTVIGVAEATAVEVNPIIPVTFKANHPFLFVLYHKPTGTTLFMGRYTQAS